MFVYLTRRNADMTEGRGPMIPDLCFSSKELAANYIDSKPGVMGRRARWSQDKYGDWDIVPLEVLNRIPLPEELDLGRILQSLNSSDRALIQKLIKR